MKKSVYKRLIIRQKLFGILFLIISAFIIFMASTGVTVEDRDCTPILFTIPLGLYLIFTKHVVIY